MGPIGHLIRTQPRWLEVKYPRPAPHVDTFWVSQFLASNVDVCLLQIRFARLLSAESHSVAQHLHGGTSGVDTKATLISCSSPLCHYYFYYYYYCSSSLPPGSTPSLTCLPPWFLRPLCPVGRFSQATVLQLASVGMPCVSRAGQSSALQRGWEAQLTNQLTPTRHQQLLHGRPPGKKAPAVGDNIEIRFGRCWGFQ